MHPIYKNNPVELKEYVDKKMKVVTVDLVVHEGTVYTIDPVSESVILLSPDNCSLELIFCHAIKSFEIIGEKECTMNPFEQIKISGEDSKITRNKLKEWFLKNLIPTEEDGETLKVAGEVTISSPYTVDDCLCSNEIVLKKVQDLITSMPT